MRGLQLEGLLIRSVASGPIDCGPACGDDAGRINVRVGFSAGCARENFLVPKTALPARSARLARVRRVDPLEGDPLHCRLVAHELLKLEEAPQTHHAVAMLVWNARSFPDSFQLLHSDKRASGIHGLLDDPLSDDVVIVGDAPLLPSRKTFQNALGVLCSFGLKRGSDAPAIFTILADSFAVELEPCACDGNISYAEIDSKDASSGGVRDFAFDYDIDVESACTGANERGRLRTLGCGGEDLPLVVSEVKHSTSPPSMSGIADLVLFQDEPERIPVEIHECRTILELALELGGLEGTSGPTKRRNDEVRREPVVGLDLSVKCVMQANGIGFTVIASPLCNLGARFGVAVEEFVEDGKIRIRDDELAADSLDHVHDCIILRIFGKSKGTRLLPGLKVGEESREDLLWYLFFLCLHSDFYIRVLFSNVHRLICY